MRAATDTTAMIDFLAIAFSLPNALLNLGKPDSFLRNESSRSGLNLGSVAVLRRVVVGAFCVVSWVHRFSVSIPLPSGQSLISLRDAGTYITKIPKAEHDTPACKQSIMEGRLNLHSSA